jgi:hypothetical protein
MMDFVLAANWWEPGQSGHLDVGDVSALFMLSLAIIGALIGLGRWWLKKLRSIIREEIEEFTAPIQPTANGGNSLPDVSRKVQKLEDMILEIKDSSEETRELLLKLAINSSSK